MKTAFRRAFFVLRDFSREARKNALGLYAAQSSFFLLISSVPLLGLLVTLLQFVFPFTAETATNAVLPFLPETLREFAENIIADLFNKQAASIISVSALMLLWSASRGVLSVMRGLGRIYNAKTVRFYHERIRALLYTVAILVTLLISLVAIVFGDVFGQFLQNRFDLFQNAFFLFEILKFLFSALLIGLFALLLYRTMSPRTFRLRTLLPGALFCTAGWILFSFVFSIYINNFSNYSYIYGSLTAVVLLMLWLYFCMWFLFLGAQINLKLRDRFSLKRDSGQK